MFTIRQLFLSSYVQVVLPLGQILISMHYTLKELILNIEDNSQCVVQSQLMLKNADVAKQLVFIKINFSFIPDIIVSLESRNLRLSE